jgi:phosphate-selective porin OprO and OprP
MTMNGDRGGVRLRLLSAAAGAALITGLAGPALAQGAQPAPTDVEALKAQVRDLTALVQTMAQRDQGEIQALAAQVKALQAQVAAAAPAPVAQPRAAQAPPPSQTAEGPRAQPSRQAAQDAVDPTRALPRVVQNSTNRFQLQSADGEYSIGFTGDIQFDAGGYVGFHPDSALSGPQALSDGVNARRARIGVAGTAFGSWGYALVYDSGNSSDQTPKGIETAQIVYAGLPGAAFEIGYSNTFFTLDQATSSNDTLFLERASASNLATNLNTGDARANAGVRFFGDRYWAGAYLTGPASGDSHTLTRERFGAFQRLAVQALSGRDYSLHLGIGFDQLLQASNAGNGTPGTVSLSDQPELRIDPTTFLNTGTLGTAANPVTKAYVLDLETAATYRNLFWQGEYYHYTIDRRGLPDVGFDGAYGQVSWTLTGEAHRYNPQAASYFRIVPAEPFSLKRGGWGAWELAARYSYVDLNDRFQSGEALSADPAAVDGGRQRAYSFGLNWYPNDLMRLMLDYNHVDYDKANGVAAKGLVLGVPIGAKIDAIALRVQVAY